MDNGPRTFFYSLLSPVLSREEFRHIDGGLCEAIALQETNYDYRRRRFERIFYQNHIIPLSHDEILARNPHIGLGYISEATERVDLATSWGPMQILGETARNRGFQGETLAFFLTEPSLAVYYSVVHLSWIMKKYNRIEEILSSWNAGSPRSQDGLVYAEKVLAHYQEIRSLTL